MYSTVSLVSVFRFFNLLAVLIIETKIFIFLEALESGKNYHSIHYHFTPIHHNVLYTDELL